MAKKRAHTGCTPPKIVHPAVEMCTPGAGCTLNFVHWMISDPYVVDERSFCVGFTYKAKTAWKNLGGDRVVWVIISETYVFLLKIISLLASLRCANISILSISYIYTCTGTLAFIITEAGTVKEILGNVVLKRSHRKL